MQSSPFQHCSHCGSPDLATRGAREQECLDCGYRHFLTPIPAACALLLDSQERLLVIRRAHEPGLGRLGLPGGVIEPGETGEQAAARETLEEVGLEVPAESFRYLASLNNDYLFQGFLWPTIDLFYVAEVTTFAGLNPQASEVSETLPLPLHQVPLEDFAFGSNADAVRLLQTTSSAFPS